MSQCTFQYQAINQQGSRTRGKLRAIDRSEAYRQIAASGLRPLRIRASHRALWQRNRRVGLRDLSHFTYQFSVLMEARVPLVEGLESIAEQEPNARLRAVILDIAGQIAAGNNFTTALTPHRQLFGDVYVETIRAAEQSGNMIEVLAHLAAMQEKQYELQKNIRSAMLYPACVITALVTAVLILMLVVIPKFAAMFASRGLDLPVLTQMLIEASRFLQTWWHVLAVGVLASAFGLRQAMSRPRARSRIEGLMHRVPVIGLMLQGMAISRFAHVFGIAIRSGLGLIDALDMSARASGRSLLMRDVNHLRDRIKLGGRLADGLKTCDYLPGFVQRMLSAGEQAGELPRMTQIVARHYDREVEHLSRNVTTLIEPIMIAGLAVIVLIVALAIFLPMWDMASLMR